MDKKQAIQFLAQVASDFLATLPASAKEPFRQAAQLAINELEKPDQPKATEP